MRTTSYRYPSEHLILFVTITLVLAVIALTATATVCTSLLFVIAFGIYAFSVSKAQHQALMQQAHPVTPSTQPELAVVVEIGLRRLQPGPLEVYVINSSELNAYTFGLDDPKVVVLYSGLFRMMDRDELLFILGHEMGHVALGHTRLNSWVGGLAGIPASGGAMALMTLALLWWNRACEYSGDRAGLLACGSPSKAVSALVKLAAGPEAIGRGDLDRALRKIDAEDDTLVGSLNEALATHPMLIRRINEIKKYAASEQYRQLAQALNKS